MQPTSLRALVGGRRTVYRQHNSTSRCKNKNITSAPRAVSVSMSTAVCTVICKQPATLAPFRGLESPYRLRMDINPGISFSASSISLRPHSARAMSAEISHNFINYHEHVNFWSQHLIHMMQVSIYIPITQDSFLHQ